MKGKIAALCAGLILGGTGTGLASSMDWTKQAGPHVTCIGSTRGVGCASLPLSVGISYYRGFVGVSVDRRYANGSYKRLYRTSIEATP